MSVVLRVVLAAIAYYASARLGYLFGISQGIVTFWPPAGVMLGLLALSDRREWPAFLAGGIAGNVLVDLQSGHSPALAVTIALASTGETVLAAWLVTRRLGNPVRLSSLRAVLEFTIGAAIVANAFTACLAALVLSRGFDVPLGEAWFAWWLGDGLGMLIVAPVIVIWANVDAIGMVWTRRRVLEALGLLGALVVTGYLALGRGPGWILQPDPYVIFPLLLWAALRFGLAGAVTCSLIVAGIATWNAALGLGPFALAGASNQTALQVYSFLAVASVTSLIAGAVLEERKAAERQLVASETNYHTVVDAATDVIITIDAQSRIQLANPAVERVFGYTPGELVGRNVAMLMPNEVQRDASGLAAYLATGHKDIEWRGTELTGLHKHGREVPLEVSFGELALGGGHVFTGILRDMSERRAAEQALQAAEERMRFALETSRVGLWDSDFTTGATRWSATLEALHGLDAGSFAGTFDAFVERIHPDDRRTVQQEIERSTRQRIDSNLAYRTIWSDGTIHWVSGVGRTFYDDNGNPVRAAGIGLDVTERRALEEQYRQSQKMEAIGQLAGGVAHDFNNLLTVIHSNGAFVAGALPPDSPQQADIVEILRAADRAAILTRQLLAFSRQEIAAPKVLNLSESLTAIDPTLRRLISDDIAIVARAPDDIGWVVADAGQMEQVILNLALNARDAMPNGGTLSLELFNVEPGDLHVGAHPGARSGPHVMLVVSDTGEGMSPDVAARVFEPFFTTKGRGTGRGLGLGLSTVYGIVKQTGGSVDVSSEPGRGSTFKVYLPRVEAPITEKPPASAPLASGSETVLVVEDEVVLQRLVQRILERKGYSVLVAGSPSEAIAIAAAQGDRIHLLLTDVHLPEMNGNVLAERLEASYPSLRVLYMSGYTDDAALRRDVLEHESRFIPKPFTHDALLLAVRDALDAPMVPSPKGGHLARHPDGDSEPQL